MNYSVIASEHRTSAVSVIDEWVGSNTPVAVGVTCHMQFRVCLSDPIVNQWWAVSYV